MNTEAEQTPWLKRPPLLWGVAFYLLTTFADGWMTLHGMGDDLMMEGNPIMRWVMVHLGPSWGIALNKTVVLLLCVGLALFLVPQIKGRASWIERVPMTPWSRRWMRRGDRSWISYLPLYLAAFSQGLAALSWALLPWLASL